MWITSVDYISSCLVWGISSHVNASYPLRVHAKGIEVFFLLKTSRIYMGVSKNIGTPKWMVYNGKPYCLMDDFEGTIIFGNTHLDLSQSFPILISQ